MKKTISAQMAIAIAATLVVSNVSLASLAVNYAATAAPSANPDGNNGSNNVDVWTFNQTVSDHGGNFLAGNHDGNNNVWAIFDNSGFGGTTATHTFAGGALLAGQTLSLDYSHNTNIDVGTRVGIRLLDAMNNIQTEFSFPGGGVFGKRDNGGPETATGKEYDPNDFFTVTYSIGLSGAYTATATAGDGDAWGGSSNIGSWGGSITGSLAKIQIFTDGGSFSDQYFDNLSISAVPESSALLFGGLICGVLGLRAAMKRIRSKAEGTGQR